jgi:hypothetical protein
MVFNMDQPTVYRIRVKGHLDDNWSEWFDGLTINNEPDGEAVLSAAFVDQAALHAVLARIHSLNLRLISVMQEALDTKNEPNDSQK